MPPARLALALNAMNTRFELVLHGGPEASLRATGEEALREIERVEALLSAFRPTSEISAVNAHASAAPVQVSPEVFALLVRARELHAVSGGAFDITLGPLMRRWGLWGTSEGRMPSGAELELARQRTGFQHLELNDAARTVRFLREGMTLDLGAMGKGYGLDCAAEVLRELGMKSAFLHGGTSSVLAIGTPPDQDAWKTALNTPGDATTPAHPWLATLELADTALAVSAVSSKAFVVDDRILGHVLDPRTGWPVQGAWMAAVLLPDATAADALSTALLVLGRNGLGSLAAAIPGFRGLVVTGTTEQPEVNAHGLDLV